MGYHEHGLALAETFTVEGACEAVDGLEELGEPELTSGVAMGLAIKINH